MPSPRWHRASAASAAARCCFTADSSWNSCWRAPRWAHWHSCPVSGASQTHGAASLLLGLLPRVGCPSPRPISGIAQPSRYDVDVAPLQTAGNASSTKHLDQTADFLLHGTSANFFRPSLYLAAVRGVDPPQSTASIPLVSSSEPICADFSALSDSRFPSVGRFGGGPEPACSETEELHKFGPEPIPTKVLCRC